MPRTKIVKKKPTGQRGRLFQCVENNKQFFISTQTELNNNFLIQLRYQLQRSKLSITKNVANKTIAELEELPLNWSGNSTSASVTQMLNATKTLTVKKKRITRASSVGDDEGYLTAESSKSTSGGRRSRTRSRAVEKSMRVSRSASVRSKTADKYKTPANKSNPTNYGLVTPKVKPNTPQIVLRRPNTGEVALSFQGSPLLTGAFTTDTVANINIPLEDGRMLSIQPQKGLRMSQIPSLNLETKRQLETLRDNLNKVCALSCKR